jgi:tol-pal system beta propeller repeat protein TolB
MNRVSFTRLGIKKTIVIGAGLLSCCLVLAKAQVSHPESLPTEANSLVASSVAGVPLASSDQESAVQLDVHARAHAKSVILLAPTEPISRDMQTVISVLEKDLSFTDQFDVRVQPVKALQQMSDVQALGSHGYSLVFFFSQPAPDTFEWRLYDVTLALMVQGKKYVKRGNYSAGWAHNLSDMMWPALTGQDGFFSSKIAYCKEVKVPRKKKVSHIYIADYDGSNEQLLVNTPTVTIAPRWNNDLQKPLLFYSEYTNANVRLMIADMHKTKKIASNFDGINMVPSFSKDGKQVVYCASRGDGCCHIYHLANGVCKRITRNKGNNVSPTFADDNKTIYFSSDFQTGLPQIFSYNLQTQELERITHDGYCACPTYNAKRGLAYTKRAGGVMQLFLYDPKTKQHRQLTFDGGDKDEPSWSPCGNNVLFSCERNGSSRIALLNLLTNQRRYLTPEKQKCMYPSFSPVYDQVPVIS